MTPTTRSYEEMDVIAKGMGLSGKGGIYTTSLGLEVDCTATAETRLAIGYRIAQVAGHITKW